MVVIVLALLSLERAAALDRWELPAPHALGAFREHVGAAFGVPLDHELPVAYAVENEPAQLSEVGDLHAGRLHALLVLLVVPLLVDVRVLARELRGPVAAAVPEARLEEAGAAGIEH